MDTNFSFEYIKSTATAGKIKSSLKECIASRTKNILSDIAKEYGICNISKLKKAELCEKVEQVITSEKENTFAQISSEDKKCFKALCENGVMDLSDLKCDLSSLVKKGFVFVFSSKEDYKVVVPEEFKALEETVFEENPYFDKFIKAGLSLYGYIEVMFLAKLVSGLSDRKELEEEFKAYVNSLAAVSNDFALLNGNMVEKSLVDSTKLNKLKGIISGEPLYKPTMEQIEIYAVEGNYEETPQTKKLCDYVTTYVTGNKAETQKIVAEIISKHRTSTSYSVEKYTARFVAHGYRFQNIQVEAKVVSLIVEAIAHVRLWAYRGYTVEEKKELLRSAKLKAAKRPVAPIVSPKIRRNDPCPCGSGKKYKKCCGK